MTTKSKWFVVATEGATTDGRNINRHWIEQMAKNYDPVNTYGARVNLEHFKAWYYRENDPHAKRYGDVLALKSEAREDGKLQLLAQISPTEELVAMNKARQKIYTSVEINPNFADTGEAYLVGLAVTDDPASLGTEMLKFAQQSAHNPLHNRKLTPENLFSETVEAVLEFTEAQEKEKEPFFQRIKALFSKNETNADARFSEHEQAIELLAKNLNAEVEKFNGEIEKFNAELEKLNSENHAQKTELANANAALAELREKLTACEAQIKDFGNQPAAGNTARPEITGEIADNGRFF